MDKTKEEVLVWLDETPGWEPGWMARRKGFPAGINLRAKTAEEAVKEAAQRFPSSVVVKVVEVDPPEQPSASSRKLMSDVAALERQGIGTKTAMFLALETE